jgi:hypothetical protein
VQEERYGCKDGVEGAGIGLFMGAGRVPVPDMVKNEVFAVAEADEGVVDGEAEEEEGPQSCGSDGQTYDNETIRLQP